MKIKKVTDEGIWFDNGSYIYHEEIDDGGVCWNYADWKSIEDEAYNFDFPKVPDFEVVDEVGFKMGRKDVRMFFIPVYSCQSGCYDDRIKVYMRPKPDKLMFEVSGQLT